MSVVIDDFALVIMAHNNPAYLARSVDYYRRLDCHKIIADSSADPVYTPGTVPDGYDYRHLPVSYYAKQRRVAATLEESLVMPVGCDDFVVPETLAKFTAYLKGHPECVSIAGQHIAFMAAGDRYRYALKHSTEYLHLVTHGVSGNVYARLSTAMTPAYGLIYSVMRRDVWREIATSQYARGELIHPGLHDRYVQLMLAAMGNVKVLPEFFLARSVAAKPASFNGRPRMPMAKLMLQWPEGSVDEYFHILLSVAGVLNRTIGLPVEAGANFVDGVIRRSLWGSRPWTEDDALSFASIGQRADAIDAELEAQGRLIVTRRDRTGTPFPEADQLFPVYQAAEQMREIRACVERHPVERNEVA